MKKILVLMILSLFISSHSYAVKIKIPVIIPVPGVEEQKGIKDPFEGKSPEEKKAIDDLLNDTDFMKKVLEDIEKQKEQINN